MSAEEPSPKPVSAVGTAVGSFAAGVGAMALTALLCSTAAGGGFSLQNAHAATVKVHHQATVVPPVDVSAVEAQLAEANVAMTTVHNRTDDAVSSHVRNDTSRLAAGSMRQQVVIELQERREPVS